MRDDNLLLVIAFLVVAAYLARQAKEGRLLSAAALAPALVCLAFLLAALGLDQPPGASLAAAVLMLLLAPVFLVKRAASAIRREHHRAARVAMGLAYLLRPNKQMRLLRKTSRMLCDLSSGQVALDQLLVQTAALPPNISYQQQLLLLGYNYDIERLYPFVKGDKLAALTSTFSANAMAALGEFEGSKGIADALTLLAQQQALKQPSSHTALSFLVAAAHLGCIETVRNYRDALQDDVTDGRLLHIEVIALQRADRPAEAEALLQQAKQALDYRSRCELEYRRRHPLKPSSNNVGGACASVAAKLQHYADETCIRSALRTPGRLSLLIALSLIAGYAMQMHQGSEIWALRHGAVAPFSLATPWWRHLSYGWCHVDTAHLIINLVGLLYFGFALEGLCGRLRLWIAYLGGVLLGGYCFALSHHEAALALGASGGVMALFGAFAAHLLAVPARRRSKEGRMHLRLLLLMAVAQLCAEFALNNSAASAHAGGAAWGFFSTLIASTLNPHQSSPFASGNHQGQAG